MRGARGGGGDRKPQAKRPNAPSQLLPGRAQLEIMLADAHYELEQDPYRGLRLAAETNGNTTGPWQACCWGILPSDEYDEYDFDASEGATLHQLTSSPEATVQYLCHCSCPSLTAWTRQHQSSLKSRAKKRKSASNERGLDKKLAALAVGQRQDDPAKSKFYMCDYNPFCLASLGGVMDDILQERSEEVQQQIRSTLQLEDENNTDDEAEESTTDNKEMSNKRPKVINLTNEDDDGARSAVSAMDDTVAADSKKNNMSGDSNMEFTGDESKEWDKTAKPGLHVNDLTANDGSKKEASRTSSASQAIHVPPPTPFDDSKIASSRGAVAKVFTRELKAREGEDHPFKIEYSKFTRESLNELRKGQGLDVEPIQKYLSLRMEGRGGELTPRTFLEQLRRWHKSILFTNPNLRQEKQNMSDRILLSLPPGISNLGATCYLNTQLQCLAQNTTFLEGIFSWKHQDGEDGMNSVMSSLQELLAQMLLGGNNKLTTSNFSKALGLDLDEQQDPNEFARLLFDRMDESFNKCGDPQLSNLLQKIFRGVVTYETTCKTCRSVSAREEAFMDLNLPIVQPENDDTSNATPLKGQTTLEQAFASNKNVDTDVQYCLETYLSPEKLDGDNQYFCGACDCKRDAERVLKVTSLPPVLNVQLSRYVFDRKKFTKKKLSDKVLLPSALQLCEKQFLLCAVMRHQGKSAYSGHYVAEAMDWTTGLWFEFNDEKVKLLEAGPSCSYDPKNGVPKRGSSGSTDAYNMYYVEKSYLNERSLSSIIRRGGFVDDLENSSKGSDSSILVQESNARKMRYSLVSDMCTRDWRMSDRFFRRRLAIRESMFPSAASLVPSFDFSAMNENDSPVWVSAEPLRKFLACDESLDTVLQGSGPLLCHQMLLCEHNALHPRTARTGKLLPRNVYDCYVSLLQQERNLLKGGEGDSLSESTGDLTEINDAVITPNHNLFCKCCAENYQKELKSKVELLGLLKELHSDLDPKNQDCNMENVDEDDLKVPNHEYGYALHKPFGTRLRRMVASMIKSVVNIESGSDDIASSPLVGIDGVDISMFGIDIFCDAASSEVALPRSDNQTNSVTASRDLTAPGEQADTNRKDDDLDPKVNSAITCPHGNSNDLSNKRLVRFLSYDVWSKLKRVFPEAIEHKRLRMGIGDDSDGYDDLRNEYECKECDHDQAATAYLFLQLQNWAKKIQNHPDLKLLYDNKGAMSSESLVHNFTVGKQGCKLVDRADIQTWRKVVHELAKDSSSALGKAKNLDDLKNDVESLAFPSHHRVVLEFETQPVERLFTSLRSLICQQHHCSIQSALFQDIRVTASDGEDPHKRKLSNEIAVVPNTQYFLFIRSLADLLDLLNSDDTTRDAGSENSPLEIDDDENGESVNLRSIRETLESYHPGIRRTQEDEDIDPEDPSSFYLEESDKSFVISPTICDCKSCELAFLQQREDNEQERKDCKPSGKGTGKKNGAGSAADQPILVESDAEDEQPKTFELRVYELDHGASVEEAIPNLREISAIPQEPAQSPPGTLLGFISRRSTRRKAARYPNGKLLGEAAVKVAPHYNIAALRLLLFEQCEVGIDTKLYVLVSTEDDGNVKYVEIEGDSVAKQLSEYIENLDNESKFDDSESSDPFASVVLLYQKDDIIDLDKSDRNTDIMDHLLEISNINKSKGNTARDGKARNRPAERGFSGTLLGSSRPTVAPSDDGKVEDSSMDNNKPPSEASEEIKDGVEIAEEDSLPQIQRPQSPVVVDESDGASVELSPTRKETKRKRDANENEVNATVIDDADSSEDESPVSDELISQVSQSLVALDLGLNAGQTVFWEAAKWAVANNHGITCVATLRDAALDHILNKMDQSGMQ